MSAATQVISQKPNIIQQTILPAKVLTDGPAGPKITGNNANLPGEIATGNNTIQKATKQTPDHHKPTPEPKEQATRGNNEVGLLAVAPENVGIGKAFILDGVLPKDRANDVKKIAEKRPFLNANNEEELTQTKMSAATQVISQKPNIIQQTILPAKVLTDGPAGPKITGNNANLPGEIATGNNTIQKATKQTPDHHKPTPEPKEQATRGNNEVGLLAVAPENVGIGKAFILDGVLPKDRANDVKKIAEKRPFLNANNEEDIPTIQRAPESTVYPVIPSGAPLASEVDNLKCSEVRWLYENEKGILVPFANEDSLKTEIKYRMRNGIHLDEAAKKYYNSNPGLDVCGVVETGEVRSSGGSHDTEQGCILVGDGYYRVSMKNQWIHPVYWKNDVKRIVRGYYFTMDNKPIEEKEVNAINENLDRFFKQQKNPDTKLPKQKDTPPEIKVGQTIIKFNSTVDITIQREGKNPMSVGRYPRPANWSGEKVEVEQLVFVVHGIWHNDNEQGIVDNAKLLIAGVKDDADKPTGIVFLPIHWRTNLEENDKHICDKKCSKESYNGKLNLILEDLKLYNCWFYGDKIRKRVLHQVNQLFHTFMINNPNFKGKVSFFGHSLGSLICYDILTLDALETDRKNFGFKKIEKLFAVGSPLWFFLGEGGENAQKKFRKALESYRIFNIYHPTDFVASPLEPLVLSSKNGLAIELPAVSLDASQPFASFLSNFAAQFKKVAHWFVGKVPDGKTDFVLPHPIDHVLQTVGTLSEIQSHSIYWGHPSVFNFIKFVFARDSYTYQKQLIEQQSPVRMPFSPMSFSGMHAPLPPLSLPTSPSFSNLLMHYLDAIESDEQEAMFQIYNYS